jgi:secreted trypsin-like serine protease
MFRDNLTRQARLGGLVAFAAALSGAPASAVVGPSESGARFADHLVMVLARGDDREGFCTGIVLGPRAVLTAAHCLRPTRDMAVVYRDAADKPVLVAVAAAVSHPLYRANAIAERQVSIDLALIETETPLDPRFTPLPLAEGDGPAVGDETILAGYGVAREGAPSSGGALRSARLKVRAPLSRILLWAEDGAASGAGACGGDSGAPLFLGDGQTVAAIVAWTSGAERGKHCGGLTQGPLIAPQRDWIAATLAQWAR